MRTLFAITLVLLTYSADAWACGGLFCDGGGPQQVNQSAERIIFAHGGEGSVTAVVQILYEGSADEFGWVLPVPGVPAIGVSSNVAFARLQNVTNPTYVLNTTFEGECRQQRGVFATGESDSVNNFDGNNDSPVQVLQSGVVGPYDYVVIQTGPQIGAQTVIDWLNENRFVTSDTAVNLIQEYLDIGMNLIAFRLSKSSDVGDIRPVTLTYNTDRPMIPIKLTAVAANDDMGVLVWVLGQHRAVPLNYKSLELNDTLINWFNPNANYNDVVNRAADEANGQGFVTEMADRTELLQGVIMSVSEIGLWTEYFETSHPDARTFLADTSSLLDRLYGGTVDGIDVAIDAAFPRSTDEQKAQIAECWECVAGSVNGEYDEQRGKQAFREWVYEPLLETQQLIDDHAWFTRLYTTMSAADMSVDPEFDLNPDVDAVSNQHTAERVIECNGRTEIQDAPWRTTVPSGFVVRGTGSLWPIGTDADDLPANITISRATTSGEPRVEVDNVATIRRALDRRNAEIVGAAGCGCRTTQTRSTVGFLFVVALLLVVRRRRR